MHEWRACRKTPAEQKWSGVPGAADAGHRGSSRHDGRTTIVEARILLDFVTPWATNRRAAEAALTFGELRAAASAPKTVLLALFHAGIPRQKTAVT